MVRSRSNNLSAYDNFPTEFNPKHSEPEQRQVHEQQPSAPAEENWIESEHFAIQVFKQPGGDASDSDDLLEDARKQDDAIPSWLQIDLASVDEYDRGYDYEETKGADDYQNQHPEQRLADVVNSAENTTHNQAMFKTLCTQILQTVQFYADSGDLLTAAHIVLVFNEELND